MAKIFGECVSVHIPPFYASVGLRYTLALRLGAVVMEMIYVGLRLGFSITEYTRAEGEVMFSIIE